jgi:quercetin dioxygenase-like cupin family protein
MKVTVGKAEYILDEGDSIYFDAALPHGQSALNAGDGSTGRARFITIIQEWS